MTIKIKEGSTILFQGDSITDASRIRLLKDDLGKGYVSIIGNHENYSNVKIINKGVYGNTTSKLRGRWNKDTLNLDFDVMSILIGINDTWRRYDRGDVTTEKCFEENYEYLLQSVTSKNPKVKIIIMAPFLVPLNAEQELWREDLVLKQKIVKKLAKKYHAKFIDLDKIFLKLYSKKYSKTDLTRDGVHPTSLGHKIIANEWMKVLKVNKKRNERWKIWKVK